MKQAPRFFSRFWRACDGATAVEYAMICALIGCVIVAGVTSLGKAVAIQFNGVATSFSTAVGG